MDIGAWEDGIIGSDHVKRTNVYPTPAEYAHGARYSAGKMSPLLSDEYFDYLHGTWDECTFEDDEVEVVGTSIGGCNVVVGHLGILNETPANRAFILRKDLPPEWLDTLIPCNLDWNLFSAAGISDDYYSTYISGSRLHNGQQRAYLLVRR
jgi:hypothetical protein